MEFITHVIGESEPSTCIQLCYYSYTYPILFSPQTLGRQQRLLLSQRLSFLTIPKLGESPTSYTPHSQHWHGQILKYSYRLTHFSQDD